MLRSILRRSGLAIVPPADPLNLLKAEGSNESDDVKLSHCWSSVSCVATDLSSKKDQVLSVVDERGGLNGRPASLLSIFKEVEIPCELIPPVGAANSGMKPPSVPPRPGETTLAPRNMRMQSEHTLTMNVISDLKEICDMAEGIDETESEHSGRSSVVERRSPSVTEAQRIRPQLTPQPSSPASDRFRAGQIGGIQQLSPLEIARQRLAQTPDVFEFDPPRMTPTGGFASSSQFHFPGGAQSPYPFVGVQPSRGMPGNPVVKRRRGRKAANMGDRTGDQSSSTVDPLTGMVTTSAQRRPRGTTGVRRPRRPRKAAQLAASQTHTHQFPGPIDRPILQRSFSEMQYSTQSPQAALLSSVNRMNTISGGEGLGGSSDEESISSPSTQTAPQLTLSSLPLSSTPSQPTTITPSLTYPSPSQYKPNTATGSSQSSMKSSTGSTGSNTPVAASPSPSVNPALPLQPVLKAEPAILKPRKSPKSLEAVVGKLHNKSSPSVSALINPYAKSDIYDDESGSPVKTEPTIKTDILLKNEPILKSETNIKPEVHHIKRESPPTSVASTSPSSRNIPITDQPQPDLKIILKVKQPAPSRSSTPSQYTSNISPPSRLIGQPPSSSRSKEEKALARQKAREKARREDDRFRKPIKREKKEKLESTVSSKKPKLDRPIPEQKKQVTSRAELPSTLAFASLKNFKIPKVIENEKSDLSQQQSNSASTSTAAPSTSAPSSNAQGSSSGSTQSQHTPKPKSILKSLTEQIQPPIFRPTGGMPPMLPASGRKSLLPHPDPRTMQYSSRPGLPFSRHLSGGMPPQPPPSSGRWMTLAPQKNTLSKSPNLEGSAGGREKGVDPLKTADSPTEGLKIVADDD